jgi:hypothetical protein
MVNEWPRLGIFLISVTIELRFCRLWEVFAIAQGADRQADRAGGRRRTRPRVEAPPVVVS